ncbi:MAG: hypothetical protein WC456_00440 [Patescibacteria group bacterium]
MFEKFVFSAKQIEKYFSSAAKDFSTALKGEADVRFVFCYNCLLKLAIVVCAKNNLRVKARRGHHIVLIEKMAGFLEDKEIEIIAQEMRAKRNRDLYDGGILISKKDAEMYLEFVSNLINRVEKYLGFNKLF